MPKKPHSPGSGERRAIVGLEGQYRFAASLVLRRLRDESLEWLRLADPAAGRVDDIQVATASRVDGYQVKWSLYPGPMTFAQLTVDRGDAPNLVRQLADGWERLRSQHPGRSIGVHLVTNNTPSVSDQPPGLAQAGEPHHFAAFLSRCWTPFSRNGTPPNDEWEPALKKWAEASGLTSIQFAAFAQDCTLDFGVSASPFEQTGSPFGTPAESPRGPESAIWHEDVDHLIRTLQRIVTDPRARIEVSREELLQELGWTSRLEFRSRHEFPTPTIPYREILASAEGLREAIERHRGGYLVLLGTPGSGKSTLLSQTLRYGSDRTVYYYAYVPDSPNAHRGESANFLHDVTLSFDRLGFRPGPALPRADVALLSERLHEQLQMLGAQFVSNGQRSILVIDGLDHISREQTPTRPLFADLPVPASIPEGVHIILGSQTDNLPQLPIEVVAQLQEPNRRLMMAPLRREDVLGVLSDAGLAAPLGSDRQERVVALSDGHPLALAYIVHALRAAEGDYDAALGRVEPFRDRIDVQYLSHWRAVSSDVSVVRLLAKLSRVRGAFGMAWVEQWADRNALFLLSSRFSQYFLREADGRWHFFHNSFRVFLQEQTRNLPGVSSESGDAMLFQELADHSALAAHSEPSRWDELYYRTRAGDDARVLAVANRDDLWRQFLSGRPAERIREDVVSALSMAEALGDAEALFRLVLLSAEFEQRAHFLDEVPLRRLLLTLAWPASVVVEHTRRGGELLVCRSEAMLLSKAFGERGLESEGSHLFSIAEPLELLGGSASVQGIDSPSAVELLDAWVDAAPSFRPVRRILDVVEQVKHEGGPSGSSDPQIETTRLRARMKFNLVCALVASGRWEAAESAVAEWEHTPAEYRSAWFYSIREGWLEALQVGDVSRAGRWWQWGYDEWLSKSEAWSDEELTALAEGALRVRADPECARQILRGVGQPSPVDSLGSGSGGGLQPFAQRFRLNRLLAALGEGGEELSELLPDPADERNESITTFERLVVAVARMQGEAWAGHVHSPATVVALAHPVIRFTSRPFDPGQHWHRGADATRDLHQQLVQAAQLHGQLRALTEAYEAEWSQPELYRRWPVSLVRDLLVSLFEAGVERARVLRRLEELETEALDSKEATERLENAVDQLEAYVALGERASADRMLRTLLEQSLSPGYKDDQFESWLEWARMANAADAGGARERVSDLASLLPGIAGLDGATDAVRRTLSLAFEPSADCGIPCLTWMLEHELLRYTDGVERALSGLLGGANIDAVQAAFRHFVLPLNPSPSAELVRRLAISAIDRSAAPAPCLARLVQSISTLVPSPSRNHLLRIIDDVALPSVSGWSKVAGPPTPPSDSSDRLEHFAGGPQSEEDVARVATSVSAVRDLVARERPQSYFGWHRVLPELTQQLSRPEVDELVALFKNHERRGAIWLLLAQRLNALGDTTAAWALAEEALFSTQPHAWREYYDGGTRVGALRVLADVDPQRARALAFRNVVADLQAGQVRSIDIAIEFHRISHIVGRRGTEARMWDHVASYLDALVPQRLRSDAPALTQGGGDSTDALVGFVLGHLDHPVTALEHAAQRTVVDTISAAPDHVGPGIEQYLKAGTSEEGATALLVALRAAAERDPSPIRSCAEAAEGLTMAANQNLRALSLDLRRAVGIPAAASPPTRPLPGVYALTLPRRGAVHRLREPESTGFLEPTTDAAELVAAFRSDLDLLAKAAGLQPEALYERVSQLAPEAGTAQSALAERNLRAYLEGVGLKLTFRRPRSRQVRTAIYRAFAEIVDAGRLDPHRIAFLEAVFRDADPSTLLVQAGPRPYMVSSITERADDRYVRDGWTKGLNASTTSLGVHDDWGIVLAEDTELRWLDWSMPTERRRGAVTFQEHPIEELRRTDDVLSVLCSLARLLPMSEYGEHEAGSDQPILFQHSFEFDTPYPRWLAFNPTIALRLGWRLAPWQHGLFRWEDDDGHLMVESICWEDGSWLHRPPDFDVEVARGWIVRATREGWGQLSLQLPPLLGYAHIARERTEEGAYSVVERVPAERLS